ncbi:MAG TPA: AMP-binding protein [Nevskiaceae bacterium]|nr:AMP-binding protein [Nevskiaceae bacterium]
MSAPLADRRKRFLARHPLWRSVSIAQLLSEAAAAYPQRPFVMAAQRSYSYAEMDAWSMRLARGLVALGVEAGDHVAMVMANHPQFVALKFAIARCGAIAVPLNFLFRTDELRYVLKQSDAAVLVTMEKFRNLDYLHMLDEMAPGWDQAGGGSRGAAFPKLRAIVTFDPEQHTRAGVPDLAELEAAGAEVAPEVVDARQAKVQAGDIVDIVYTSGTTGFPKGAMLTHDNVLHCAYSSVLIRALDDGHKTLFALPLYHVFAYVEGLLAVMYVGGAVIPQLAFDPLETFKAIQDFAADEALMVPTMTIALVEHPKRSEYDLHTLRTVMSAASPAPVRVWELVRKELGVREIVTAYGQTEASASTTYTMPDDPLELVATTIGRAKPGGPCGDPKLGTDPVLGPLVCLYKTVDPTTGADLPPGVEGELALYGAEVMRGYYKLPDKTAAVLDKAGWMRSGDLGRIRPDGYIQLTGRSKELYKCGGELVAPKEIEELLSARPDVSQVYVVGVPDERMGEIGCAFVIPAPGATLDEAEVIGYCQDHLARFKVPVHVLPLEVRDLPTTATGKVQKFKLVKLAQQRLAGT